MQHIGGGMWSNLISAAASSQGSAERGGGTPAPKSHRCPRQPNWCRDTAQSYLDDRILCHRTKKKKKERRYESLPLGDVERVRRTEIFGLLLEIADWGTTVPESHMWTQCHPIPVLVQFVAKQQCYFLGVLLTSTGASAPYAHVISICLGERTLLLDPAASISAADEKSSSFQQNFNLPNSEKKIDK